LSKYFISEMCKLAAL